MSIARRLTIGLAMVFLGGALVGGILFHLAGNRAYIVHTGSMTGTLDTGDLIIDRPVKGALHVGEVITFLHSGQASDVVTHRIVSLNDGTIQTKGDANSTPDTWNIRHDQVKGVVATSIPKAGYVVYFFSQRAGDAAAMTGLIALVLIYGLFFGSPAPATERGTRGHRRTLESTSV